MVSNLLKFKSGCTFTDDLLRKYITKIYYDFRSFFFKRAHTCAGVGEGQKDRESQAGSP